MIELYSLHWSHYVEKVRWALDYKRLDYIVIPVSVPGKREMAHLECAGVESSGAGRVLTVPTIHDSATGACVTDSSEIIAYLETTYPQSPWLLGETPAERQEILGWMLRLDIELGLAARRLAYTQLILEAPDVLPELFLQKDAFPARWPFRHVAAVTLAGMLIQRFRFMALHKDGALESVAAVLRCARDRIACHRYLAGNAFNAADLSLAALLRPLRIVPALREAAEFSSLFEWQETLFRDHGRDAEMVYEKRIRERRKRRGRSAGIKVLTVPGGGTLKEPRIPMPGRIRNDQHALSRVRLAFAWLDCLRLRRMFSGNN